MLKHLSGRQNVTGSIPTGGINFGTVMCTQMFHNQTAAFSSQNVAVSFGALVRSIELASFLTIHSGMCWSSGPKLPRYFHTSRER